MGNKYRRRLFAASVTLGVFASLLFAVNLTPTSAAIGTKNVQQSVDVKSCQACHGSSGISKNASVPNIAGQKLEYLVAQLKAFKSKDRKNDLMSAIAAQLSDADMRSLAQYWSSRPSTPAEADAHASGPAIPSRMTFPANFPDGFTLYQTVTDEGSITKRYANAVAIKAVRAGQGLPDGSVVIGVNYEAKKDASGAVVAGAVKSYAAMESRAGWGDAIPLLLRNGNWDYAVFNGEK